MAPPTDEERVKARTVICRVIRDWTGATWLIADDLRQ